MKRYHLFLPHLLSVLLIGALATGCAKKTDEALLTEYNAKKAEAQKLITEVTDGLKKINEEQSAWAAQLSEATTSKTLDTVRGATLSAELKTQDPMIPVVQAGVDSLQYWVNAKAETNDELKTAIAALNAHLAAVGANWKALSDAHTKAGADIMAALASAPAAAPAAGSTATEGTTTTKTKTTTTTTTSSEKHETAKHTPGGTAKVPPSNAPSTSTPTDQSKHEPAKQTPGGTPKTPPSSGGTKK